MDYKEKLRQVINNIPNVDKIKEVTITSVNSYSYDTSDTKRSKIIPFNKNTITNHISDVRCTEGLVSYQKIKLGDYEIDTRML